MKEPTPEIVRGLWAHMAMHFGCRVIRKGDAAEMRLVAFALGQLGILDPAEFLNDYATTIGNRIYLPFEIGVPTGGWSLWGQAVVCVHECQHVYRGQQMGLVTYGARYLTSSSQRAAFEAEAYRATLEMEWWRSRSMPDPTALAGHLRGYGVTDTDIEVTAVALRTAADAIRRGAIVNKATSVALAWLEEHAPDLRVR